MKKIVLPVRGMTCVSCAKTVESVIKSKGLKGVKVDFASGRATVEGEDFTAIKEASKELREFGYVISSEELVIRVKDFDPSTSDTLYRSIKGLDGVISVGIDGAGGILSISYSPLQISYPDILKVIRKFGYEYEIIGEAKEERKELTLFQRFLISLPFTIGVVLGSHFKFPLLEYKVLQGIFSVITVFVAGYPIIRSGAASFLRWKLNMNSLITLGTVASIISFDFEPASIIMTLILFGKSLEENLRKRALREIGELIESLPKFAFVEKNGKVIKSYTGDINPGDIVVVKSGEKVPVDGTIVEGGGEVSLALLTGESLPTLVKEGDEVYAGSVLTSGFLRVKTEKVGEDTFAGNLRKVVFKAQEEKNRIQRLADKISAHFTVFVMLVSAMTLIGWVVITGNINKAILSAVSVVVVACPCALGIATPVAVAVAVGRATKRGLLIKHPSAVENANGIKVVGFDKTGTLTYGRPEVVRFEGNEKVKPFAGAISSRSSHVYSKAIYRFCGDSELKVENFKETAGVGIEGYINGKHVKLGKGEFVGKEGYGVWVYVEGVGYGRFIVEDRIKDVSKETVKRLKDMGLKVFIISGDNEVNTRKVADEVGVDGFFADVLPEEKVDKVKYLKKMFGKVCFVGDGINDAPVLSNSDLGIAIGSATDMATISGDVVVLRGDIDRVPEVIKVSQKTYRRIVQNLFWAFFYNSLLIPMAAAGYVPPEISALAMSISSISVVLNSIRP